MNEVPSVDAVIALYDGPVGSRRYDEFVTEREHALQCAALAASDGAPPALVAAALLHDVGHLVDGGAAATTTEASHGDLEFPEHDDRHEATGARILGALLGPAVAAPVALHVAAKRYLCAVDDTYNSLLSPSSVHSLAMQGGPMTPTEVEDFRRRSGWDDAVRLRWWDDAGKVEGAPIGEFVDHGDLLRTLARS